MPLDDINRLEHMLESATEAQEFMKGVTRETLSSDRKTVQAGSLRNSLVQNFAEGDPTSWLR